MTDFLLDLLLPEIMGGETQGDFFITESYVAGPWGTTLINLTVHQHQLLHILIKYVVVLSEYCSCPNEKEAFG